MPLRGSVKEEDEEMSDPVKCAVCQEEMDDTAFVKHNLTKHNMLAWREGDEEIDLNNEKLVLSILNKLLKGKKKKVLNCDTCDAEKKSALGYFTHKQVCQKSEEEKRQMRVRCDVCGRTVMPVSLRSHMLQHEKSAAAAAAVAEMAIATAGMDAVEIVGRRAAATKAKSRMMEFLADDAAGPSSRHHPKSPRRKRLYVVVRSLTQRVPQKLLRTWTKTLNDFGAIRCPHLGCTFEVDDVNKLQPHMMKCSFVPSNMVYLCMLCLLQCNDEMEMVQHVRTQHDDVESDMSTSEVQSSSDEEFNSGLEEADKSHHKPTSMAYRPRAKTFTPSRTSCRSTFLANEEFSTYSKELEAFPPALRWTLNFRLWNHSETLFPEFRSRKESWVLIEGSAANEYLPTDQMSVFTEFQGDGTARRFSLFESDVIDGGGVIFTGGPVWAMAWSPLPLQKSMSKECELNQYLAISCHRNMDEYHLAHSCYSAPNVIQFWDCGPIENNRPLQTPKLKLALAHDFGTVWDLQWCPSGCYDMNSELPAEERMGLLAAACSDGTARVFAICKPQNLTAHLPSGTLPVYKTEPVLTLVTDFPQPSQCTRVSWYSGKSHWLLAASFCNGMVGLWDIRNFADLLWDSESRILRPYHCFQAHLTVVAALSLSPHQDGRYLMTGSHDRSVKFWDLEDTSSPITVQRRNTVTDGIWLGHWICCIAAYDDAFLHEHTNATLTPARDFGYKPYPMLPQNSVGWSLSYNEWLNAVAQGSEAGEVTVNFASQLLVGLDNEKGSVERRAMLSYTLLKELLVDEKGQEQLGNLTMWKSESTKAKGKSKQSAKGKQSNKGNQAPPEEKLLDENEEVEPKPQMYGEAGKKYGLSLIDLCKVPPGKNRASADAMAQVRLSARMNAVWSDMYPLTSVNRVCWNPNSQSFLWLAAGHHCGLVRLICVQYMQNAATKSFLLNASKAMQ